MGRLRIRTTFDFRPPQGVAEKLQERKQDRDIILRFIFKTVSLEKAEEFCHFVKEDIGTLNQIELKPDCVRVQGIIEDDVAHVVLNVFEKFFPNYKIISDQTTHESGNLPVREVILELTPETS